MRAAAKDLDDMMIIASWGAGEDVLMEEFKEIIADGYSARAGSIYNRDAGWLCGGGLLIAERRRLAIPVSIVVIVVAALRVAGVVPSRDVQRFLKVEGDQRSCRHPDFCAARHHLLALSTRNRAGDCP